jgi:beta-lactam-binding protein with PASTA domain
MSPKMSFSIGKNNPIKDSLGGKGGDETPGEKDFFRKSMLIILALLLLLFLSFLLSFFVAVRGAEKTLVPDVKGDLLIDALIDLQEKELYPRIQVRFSEDPMEKDHIISQDPQPGSVVRAGRRVKLIVSKGAVVDTVGNYVGKDMRDVKTQLQTLFASYKPLLIIKEPVSYIFDESPAGTILEQKPKAGTMITGLTEIQMVVSRGPIAESYKLDEYVGLKWEDALTRIVRSNQPFKFVLGDDTSENNASFVTEQSPSAGGTILAGTQIILTINSPARLGKEERFGVFEVALPEYPISVDLIVEKILTGGKKETILEMKHPGGSLSFPYRDNVGSTYVLKIYDEEIKQFNIQ